MKKTNFQRLTALLLCLMFVVGSFTTVTFAAQSDAGESNQESLNNSNSGQSLSEIKELLNAITYDEYLKNENNRKVPKATQTIVLDAADINNIVSYSLDVSSGVYKVGDEGFESALDGRINDTYGQTALYTSATGLVSWKINVPETGKYVIKIEYYPIEGKAAPVERVFKINNKVPFSQAHYIKLQKNWINDYEMYNCTGQTELIAKGKNAGLKVVEENGSTYFVCPEIWTQEISEFCSNNGIRFMKIDINKNELRPSASQKPEWITYALKDSNGFYDDPFEFVFEAGENILTFEGSNESMAVKSITLCPSENLLTYDEYIEKYKDKPQGDSIIKIEAEYTATTTDKTIYGAEDRSSAATSPSDVTRTLINTMGAEKWQTTGQSITYKFEVGSSGMYDIVARYRQNILDGMYVNRALFIYSEGLEEGEDGYYNGAPFDEARRLLYNYNANWQVTKLCGADSNKTYQIYFKEGVTYTIRYEVTLGLMGNIVDSVQQSLDNINDDYLKIMQLTGAAPDAYRDYGFSRVMPDVLNNMVLESLNLDAVAKNLEAFAGEKSSNVGTLQKVSGLLKKMGQDEDEIARQLERLKSYIGTLGTFISDAKTQPLQLDYIMIQPATASMPKAKPGFFASIWHEIKGLFCSFTRDYNSMGTTEVLNGDSVEVWLATGRDQSQVIRNLINNNFTPNKGISVDLRLVAASTLLPSILAEQGPDVYLGLDHASVINYAIRNAILPVDGFDDFDETIESFTDSAMLVLGIENAENELHYYGLPEQQSFIMMFVRTDILANNDIEIPKTWNDVMAAIPVLQSKKMQVGFTTNYNIFLYQMDGDLFADGGMRINLDSKIGLKAFEKTCNMFTMYGFPYQYDPANRFRTGEMPILIGDYTGLYNQLKVFATEIDGLWQFVPLPGEIDSEGNINNCSNSSVLATVMVKGCEGENQKRAWEYMKWYTGDVCQTDYSNEMVAIMGPSAKHPTANLKALESLPWTASEYEQIALQLGCHKEYDENGDVKIIIDGDNLAAVPNYPGAYIITRYTDFAFLSAYNDKADPKQAVLSYINIINKEITRKREEFGLETLEQGQTLASKRLDQASEALEEINQRGIYGEYTEKIQNAIKLKDINYINSIVAEIDAALEGKTFDIKVSKSYDINKLSNEELLYVAGQTLNDAAKALATY